MCGDMKLLKRCIALVLLLALATGGALTAMSYAKADLAALPELRSGDLIFQTNVNSQMPAILLATHSIYSHVGVVHKSEKGIMVIEAMRHVTERPLADFIHSGWGERFTVLRHAGLNDAQREAIVKNAGHYIGRPYDFVFYQNEDKIYCSELPYLAYKASGLPLGNLQKIGDLHLDNFAVRKLFSERWKMHPACQEAGMTAESCWKKVLEEPIITPVSVAEDARLTTVYSNY